MEFRLLGVDVKASDARAISSHMRFEAPYSTWADIVNCYEILGSEVEVGSKVCWNAVPVGLFYTSSRFYIVKSMRTIGLLDEVLMGLHDLKMFDQNTSCYDLI